MFFSIFDLFSQILENINIYTQIDNDYQHAHVNMHQRTQFKKDFIVFVSKGFLLMMLFHLKYKDYSLTFDSTSFFLYYDLVNILAK